MACKTDRWRGSWSHINYMYKLAKLQHLAKNDQINIINVTPLFLLSVLLRPTLRSLTCLITVSGSVRSDSIIVPRIPSFSASQSENLACSSEKFCHFRRRSCRTSHCCSVHVQMAAHFFPSLCSWVSMASQAKRKNISTQEHVFYTDSLVFIYFFN